MKKNTLIVMLFSILLLALTGCSSKEESSATPVVTSNNLIAEGQLFPVEYLDHSFTISGYVEDVLVENNEIVEEGQVLARLVKAPEADLALARAEEERIAAKLALDLLKETAAFTLATAQMDLTVAQDTYDDAVGNSWTIDRPIGSENSIKAAELALEIAKAELERSAKKVTKLSYLPADNLDKLNAQSAMVNLQQNVNTLMSQLNYLKGYPDDVRSASLSSDLAIAEASLELATSKLEKIEANGGIDPDEQAAAEARLRSAEAAVASAQAAVDAYTIKAKMDGQVVDLAIKTGQLAGPELTALSIADYSEWIIYTDNLTENEVTEISEGQPVEVVLDALPDVPLTGEVTHINSRYEEKRGEITYTVTIRLTQTDPRMRWGMTASVNFLQ